MAVLNLGVLDVSYSDPDNKNLSTTGEVAEFLEETFEVIGTFYELYGQRIADEITSVMANEISAMAKGEPLGGQPIQSAMEKIRTWFMNYLDQGEYEATTGIKIGTAQQGVSHRFKDVQNLEGKRGSRPAFVDTGLYQAAFRAWIEQWAPSEAEASSVSKKFVLQAITDRASW
jgi:hypothetical protein